MRLPRRRNSAISHRGFETLTSQPEPIKSGLKAEYTPKEGFRKRLQPLESPDGGKGSRTPKRPSKTIAYRRVAGKVGLTNQENGVRGAWVEKRVALFNNLLETDNEILLLSTTTKATNNFGIEHQQHYEPSDLLILEFGGTNLRFYKNDWEQTISIIKQHKNEILFITDDPDLSFIWNLLPQEDWSRWTIGANATNPKESAKVLKTPNNAKTIDYPLLPSLTETTFNTHESNKVIYIGRPNGREQFFNDLTRCPNLEIAGNEKEWHTYPHLQIKPYPQQRDRQNFYKQYGGCLAVYDRKHKATGWRTGRAYHALAAGIPIAAPIGNEALNWTYPIMSRYSLNAFSELNINNKQNLWEEQKQKANEPFINPFEII